MRHEKFRTPLRTRRSPTAPHSAIRNAKWLSASEFSAAGAPPDLPADRSGGVKTELPQRNGEERS